MEPHNYQKHLNIDGKNGEEMKRGISSSMKIIVIEKNMISDTCEIYSYIYFASCAKMTTNVSIFVQLV